MENETIINERIRAAIEESDFPNVSAFAKHINVLQQTLNYCVNSKSDPHSSLVVAVLRGLPDLSAEWLMRGEGPMFLPRGGAVADGGGCAAAPSDAANAARVARLEDEVRWLRGVLASLVARRGGGES